MWGKRRTKKEKEENIQRWKKYFFVRRRRTEKEKGKIFGEGKYVSVEEKKSKEGKGAKFMEKEDIFWLRIAQEFFTFCPELELDLFGHGQQI